MTDTPKSAAKPNEAKQAWKEMRKDANEATLASSKALQNDALTDIKKSADADPDA